MDIEKIRTRVMEFGPLTIQFDGRVLGPRRWTTAQSAWASALLCSAPPGPVLELCAGVGHIGLLAVLGHRRPLVMVDTSRVACDHAEANTAGARMTVPVDIRCGRMEDEISDDEWFALIIADPPWVPSDDIEEHPNDPVEAIDGGADGLDLVRTCIEIIGRHLVDEGSAVLQVGNLEQVAEVGGHVADHPELGLKLAEHRMCEGGVLVQLVR